MTDELSIQKQQPSAIPYVALGAAGVGGASYLGLPRIESVNKFMTEPAKYNSYEDIIKEADDKFENSLKSAEGAEKDLMEKAKNYREKVAEAGKDYDDKLAKEIADNVNEEFVPDENYKNLEKDLQSKTEALENKRKTLVEEKAAELRKNNTGTLTPEQKKTVARMEQSIENIEKNDYKLGSLGYRQLKILICFQEPDSLKVL